MTETGKKFEMNIKNTLTTIVKQCNKNFFIVFVFQYFNDQFSDIRSKDDCHLLFPRKKI